mmetsp:Transcript_45943/g.146663  ORF Transcript_45943/g.146663 Transcript_45943/m.146663 type:complete len:200 (+) Transcript_45943:1488-2087(+)
MVPSLHPGSHPTHHSRHRRSGYCSEGAPRRHRYRWQPLCPRSFARCRSSSRHPPPGGAPHPPHQHRRPSPSPCGPNPILCGRRLRPKARRQGGCCGRSWCAHCHCHCHSHPGQLGGSYHAPRSRSRCHFHCCRPLVRMWRGLCSCSLLATRPKRSTRPCRRPTARAERPGEQSPWRTHRPTPISPQTAACAPTPEPLGT